MTMATKMATAASVNRDSALKMRARKPQKRLPVVSKLGGQKACETVIKNRLTEIDNTELKVESVKVDGTNATAQVKSVYGGKKQIHTVTLAKEGSRWKITAIG